MPQYNFTSPGAMAGNAIEEFFVQQALEKRQRMLDEAKRVEDERRAQQQAAQLQLQQDQEARMAAEQRRRAAMEATAANRAMDERGVRMMLAESASAGPLTPENAQALELMAFREGVPVPGIIARASAPKEPPKRTVVQTTGPGGRPVRRAVTEEELIAGVPEYQEPKAAPAADNEPLIPVIGDDGQPVLMPRSKAAGRRPASTREQGRPVTSGDAGRISDLDTSLDDVEVLGQQLGATGAASAIGAALPNVVTELTGLGSDSKQRQGTIDRVKQVIGKALEGGVLRKEDEAKYAKILPTIGDPPEVARSKMEGLRAALVQRRQTLIDALADAGYDTTKFSERKRTQTAKTPTAKELIEKYRTK